MGLIGIYQPHPLGGAPPAPGDGCCTHIDTPAELEALFPASGGVHVIDQDGCYCFSSMALTNSIRIDNDRLVRVTGKGEATQLDITPSVAPYALLASGASKVGVDNIKIRNFAAGAACINVATTECYIVQAALFSNDVGYCVHTNTPTSRVDLTQVRMTNALSAIRQRGGEVFAQLLDIETVGEAVRLETSDSVSLQWHGGRVNNLTTGIHQDATITSSVQITGLKVSELTTWYFRAGGTIPPHVDISGLTCTALTGQLFHPSAQVPADMTTIYRNRVNGGGAALFAGGFSTASANARVRANAVNGTLQPEV